SSPAPRLGARPLESSLMVPSPASTGPSVQQDDPGMPGSSRVASEARASVGVVFVELSVERELDVTDDAFELLVGVLVSVSVGNALAEREAVVTRGVPVELVIVARAAVPRERVQAGVVEAVPEAFLPSEVPGAEREVRGAGG